MDQYVSRSGALPDLNFFAWVLIVLWTSAVAVSLCWSMAQQQETLEIASNTANALHGENFLYRRWALENGEIYLPLPSKIPTNSGPQGHRVGQIQGGISVAA